MPIYEYECKQCNRTIEIIQTIDTKPKVKCDCGKMMKRIISKNTFILKGGGWYETDYGKKKKGQKHGKD